MNSILKANDVTKKYKNKIVVNKLNMRINKADIYALLGRNGSGKTTTLKMITGQTSIDSGYLEVFGEAISTNDYKYKSRIGMIVETPTFYPALTARENLEIYRRCMGVQNKKRIEDVLELLNLSDVENQNVGKYSLGMKQRLGLARALLNSPEFLILDEPTIGLDPAGISQLREILLTLNKEQNTTILICSHILSEIEHMATKIGIIHKGRLLEEFTYKEFEEKNINYLKIKVNNQSKASLILEKNCGISKYNIYDEDTICIFEKLDTIENINIQLINNGVYIKELKTNNQTLEDYFIKLTEEEPNA